MTIQQFIDASDISNHVTDLRWIDENRPNEIGYLRGLFTQKKSSHTPQKNPKNPKKSKDYLEDSKSLLGSEQPLDFSV